MQRSQFDADFIELSDPGKIPGTFSPQAIGFKRAESIPDAVLKAQLQAGWLHLVKRRSASLYEYAVRSMTSAGNVGGGACLFHGSPSTLTPSSQSRRNCLS